MTTDANAMLTPPAAAAPTDVVAPRPAVLDLAEFRLGWRILLVAMLGVGINANASMLYAFGTMVLPLQKAFDWSRGDLQFGISFLFAGAVVGSQLVGWLNLRYGMRRVTFVSLASLSLVFAGMMFMGRSIAWFYLGLTLLPIASLGCMQVTWTYLVNLWFERNRGLALAVVLSGTGLAAALIPSGVAWAMGRFGWQGAFGLLALLPVLLVLPFAAAWMHEPRLAGRGAASSAVAAPPALPLTGLSFGEGVRSARFWALNLALSLIVASVVTMVTNTVPLLRDKGLTAAQASSIFAGFGLSLIFGRMVVGYLVDRLWAPAVAAVSLSLPALGCLLLWSSSAADTHWLLLATVLLGIGSGAEFDVAAYLVSRYFGLRDYGRLFGVHLGMITIASALAPWLSGSLYKSTGSYDVVLALCGGAFLAGALMLLPLGRYPQWARNP